MTKPSDRKPDSPDPQDPAPDVGAAAAPQSRRADLARRLHRAAHLTGSFTLRSGATSHQYFDKYRMESEPALLREVAEAMAPLIPDDVQVLCGLELGGVPLAVALSQVTGLPARFVRKQAKSYGTARLAEGGPVEGLRVAVVEDVVTSGGQAIASCEDLRELGARILAVLCVVDREAGGREAMAQRGLELRALYRMRDLDAGL